MVPVRVNRGPISATDFVSEVPREEWPELVRAREDFLQIRLPYDCRELLRFIEEADVMMQPLGYQDARDFITRGLKLDPVMVGWAIEGLKRLKPDEPIPFEQAVEIGKWGGDRKSPGFQESKEDQATVGSLKYGGNPAYLTARLARDRPDLLERLEAGDYPSIRQAAIAAGFVKNKTPLQQVQAGWRRATTLEEQSVIITWILEQIQGNPELLDIYEQKGAP